MFLPRLSYGMIVIRILAAVANATFPPWKKNNKMYTIRDTNERVDRQGIKKSRSNHKTLSFNNDVLVRDIILRLDRTLRLAYIIL